MLSWCVRTLPLSEPAALNRIRAARVARRFPALLEALEDGRLHLGAVLLLARWLRAENVDHWIAAASQKSKREIQWLLREHIAPPFASSPATVTTSEEALLDGMAMPASEASSDASPEAAQEGPQIEHAAPSRSQEDPCILPATVARPNVTSILEEPSRKLARAKWSLRSPGVYELHLLCGQAAYDRVVLLHELLSHKFAEAEQAEVIWHSIEVAIRAAQRQRFAATPTPRIAKCPTAGSRVIPAAVRRAVWERDVGRCTFVAEDGTRCTERRLIQFDHIIPIARGGESTVENLRLLCRTHNQFVAERLFGATFMDLKRALVS